MDSLSIARAFLCRAHYPWTTARFESVCRKARIAASPAPTGAGDRSNAAGTITSQQEFRRSEKFLQAPYVTTYSTHNMWVLQGPTCDVRSNRRRPLEALFAGAMSGHVAGCAVGASFMFARANDGAPGQA